MLPAGASFWQQWAAITRGGAFVWAEYVAVLRGNLAGHVTDDELAERRRVLALLARPSRA
jgi:hypothetical protein